jgi:hypothetical protein
MKTRRDLVRISANLGSNMVLTLLLWNFNFTPLVYSLPFAFLVEEAALIFSLDILSGTMEYGKGREIRTGFLLTSEAA